MNELSAILFLAVSIEGLITYLFGESKIVRPWLKYIALSLGIVLAISYMVDIPAMVGLISPYPFVSYVVSGIAIGRGSNVVNDLLGRLNNEKKIKPLETPEEEGV